MLSDPRLFLSVITMSFRNCLFFGILFSNLPNLLVLQHGIEASDLRSSLLSTSCVKAILEYTLDKSDLSGD